MFLNTIVTEPEHHSMELNIAKRSVRFKGEEVKLSSRAFDLLVALVERRERLVTKDELIDIVWPTVIVEENNLHVHISALRRAFGRDALVTIPGRGYQWTMAAAASPSQIPASPAIVPLSTATVAEIELHRAAFTSLDRLIGREADIERIEASLSESRWVTVVGPGGIGKTSLAQAVIARLAQRNGTQSVCWVDLAAIEAPEQILAAIAKAAAIPMTGGGAAIEALLEALALRSGLVVFDNCEHVRIDVERFIVLLLERAPALRIFATSQDAFHRANAATYRLEPLTVVPVDADAAQIRESTSFKLLERRAQMEHHRYRVTDGELALVSALCRKLDGVPLAIEMAAVRLPSLGVKRLTERIETQIEVFRNKNPEAPARQQSLRGALDWSFALLSDKERALLLHLCEFLGGFSLSAVERIAPYVAQSESDVLDTLDELISKSLVSVVSADPLRYRIAETTRLYARERLEELDRRAQSQSACLRVITDIANAARGDLTQIDDDPWLQEHFPDYENAEWALSLGALRGDAEAVAATVQFLGSLDDVRSVVSSNARERSRLAYEASHQTSGLIYAKLMSCVAVTPPIANPVFPRHEASRLALKAWRQEDDAEALANACARHAFNCATANDAAAAREALNDYLALPPSTLSPRTQLRIERLLGSTLLILGERSAALPHLERALALAEAANSKHRAAMVLLELADAMAVVERYDEAVVFGKRCIDTLRELKIYRPLRFAYSNMIQALCFADDSARAVTYALASLAAEVAMEKFDLQGDAFGLLCARSGRFEMAARFIGASDAWYRVAGHGREPLELRSRAVVARECESALGASKFQSHLAEGEKLSAADAFALAGRAFNVPNLVSAG